MKPSAPLAAPARARTAAPATEADPRWAAVLARDAEADGRFVYSVASTGIYCRPSCPSRHARPEHVRFHASAAEAAAAGFRPCRRCRPDGPSQAEQHADLVTRACRLIESADAPLPLQALAGQLGLSPWHLHRVFKAVTGLTPRAWAAARRAQRMREQLPASASVTQALYGAGYNASSRFYAQADAVLGMSARRFRTGGAGATLRFALGQCALGALLVAGSERGVCAILLGDDPQALLNDLQDRFPKAQLVGGDAAFEQWVSQVVGFVEAPALGLALPLDLRGTAFQQRVWQALRDIPPGQTTTYSALAARIGAPKAVRAVAGACAANPLAVAIPCHRVVRLDGSLSGYRWGVERKRALLAREAAPS